MQRQLEEVLDAWDGDRYGPTTELATTEWESIWPTAATSSS